MSATASVSAPPARDLTEKQYAILEYLADNADEQTYFKSRLIGEELDLSAKEVGSNMASLADAEIPLSIERWGYSSSTTWMVTG